MKYILVFLCSLILSAEQYLLSVSQKVKVNKAEFIIICGENNTIKESQIIEQGDISNFYTLIEGNCNELYYQLVSIDDSEVKLIDVKKVDTRFLKWDKEYIESLKIIFESNQKDISNLITEIDNYQKKLSAIKKDAILITQVKDLILKKNELKQKIQDFEDLSFRMKVLNFQFENYLKAGDTANFSYRNNELNKVLSELRQKFDKVQEKKEAEEEMESEITDIPLEELENEVENLDLNFSNP